MGEEFRPFSAMHLVVVILSLAGWSALLRSVARRRIEERGGLVVGLAVSLLLVNVYWVMASILPDRWNIDDSLPLHLCDLAWMVAVWALLAHDRDDSPAHQLIFFWGAGLSTQAFITPTLQQGPEHARFWFFWLPHWQIVCVSLLDLIVYRRRPTWRGCRMAIIVTLVIGGLVTLLNMKLGTPYFFTGRDAPGNPTIIDRLGSWPGRLVWLGIIVSVWFALLTWIFRERRGAAKEA